jgi:hypothetical protein
MIRSSGQVPGYIALARMLARSRNRPLDKFAPHYYEVAGDTRLFVKSLIFATSGHAECHTAAREWVSRGKERRKVAPVPGAPDSRGGSKVPFN